MGYWFEIESMVNLWETESANYSRNYIPLPVKIVI